MRKGRRFTPSLIQKWLKEGRGSGTYDEYSALHQVTRGDPGSRGLSRILSQMNPVRQEHLLSDAEYVVYLFCRMVPGLIDLREQFHLSQVDANHELSAYGTLRSDEYVPGTLAVAKELNIAHALIQNKKSAPWPVSTDLLLTIKGDSKLSLLAISVKADEILSERTQELILIERMYWVKRNIEFLLITPATYLESVAINMKTYSPWGHGIAMSPEILEQVKNLSEDIDGMPLSSALKFVQQELNLAVNDAQNAFWASVWKGYLPIDLNRRATFGTPVHLLLADAFWKQNPVVARRSAWLS